MGRGWHPSNTSSSSSSSSSSGSTPCVGSPSWASALGQSSTRRCTVACLELGDEPVSKNLVVYVAYALLPASDMVTTSSVVAPLCSRGRQVGNPGENAPTQAHHRRLLAPVFVEH